jgi:uncharacterized ferritin-like protein (DUF455 family)
MESVDTKVVRGVTLRRDPAREECFSVVHIHADMHDYADMTSVARRHRLHRHMHNEMQNIEIAAQCLADFADAPWELRMELARQCWDEARHTALLLRRLAELGGRKGEFPVMNFEWGVTGMMNSLPARLAVQNRTFEAGEMDLLRELVDKWRDAGDGETSQIMDGILADEVQHVRFANRWLKRLAKDNPRILLDVARGVRSLKMVTEALAPQPGEVNAVGVDMTGYQHLSVFANIEDRRLAEFTDEEIAEVLRQEGLGSIVPKAAEASV